MESANEFSIAEFTATKEPLNDMKHDVVFAIQLIQVDVLENYVLLSSDMSSALYGKHLSRDEITNMTYNPLAFQKLIRFLNIKGIPIVEISKHREYVTARADVTKWNELFNTEFRMFQHISGQVDPIIRTTTYHLPIELKAYVRSVFNTVQFPVKSHKQIKLEAYARTGHESIYDGYVYPTFLNSLYSISITGTADGSQCVYSTIGQILDTTDLTTFQYQFSTAHTTSFTQIGGGTVGAGLCADANNVANCGESNVDVQWITSVAPVAPLTYW